jgi:Pyruvate/2-oxoacid:ferredoxin oxidoreductase delta subunit/coenzyme F420-reducing hydrogenase delta subunit
MSRALEECRGPLSSSIAAGASRLLTVADALGNRLYGQRYNPLYQSGTIAVALYLVLIVTGVWLLLFYRVGAPWASVARLTSDPWLGNWVRGVHRYASDLAVIATIAHAVRMFAQDRTWGPRLLAWMSGCLLLLLLFVCGWTGFVMVWDTFGLALAREGARMLDTLPLLSEPTGRAFTGEQPVPTAFFFLNLFAHVGIPLGMGVLFLLHVKRVARPVLLPPRPLLWSVVGLLVAVSVVRPLTMAPEADPLLLPPEVPADWFFAFWMPITRALGGGTALLLAGAVAVALLAVPALARRRAGSARAPSKVDEDVCVGCVQCVLDCPYGAIEMVDRAAPRIGQVARVDPALCVSCGICAGSCAPMGVGPPGRTGRDQIADIRQFVASPERRAGELVVLCCGHGPAALAEQVAKAGGVPYRIDCAGNLHTSVVELLVRGGAGGVLVLSCPPRDCWHREGPKWLVERVFNGREAELQPRVPRARVGLAHVAAGDHDAATRAVHELVARIAGLEADVAARFEPTAECESALARGPR